MLTEASTVSIHLSVTQLNTVNMSLLFFSKRLALLVKLGTVQVRLKIFNVGGDYQCSGKPHNFVGLWKSNVELNAKSFC